MKYPGNSRVDYDFHTCWTECSRFGGDFWGEICLLPSVFRWSWNYPKLRKFSLLQLCVFSLRLSYCENETCSSCSTQKNAQLLQLGHQVNLYQKISRWVEAFCFLGGFPAFVFQYLEKKHLPNFEGQSLKIIDFVFDRLWTMKLPCFDLLKVGFLSPTAKIAFVGVVFWWKYSRFHWVSSLWGTCTLVAGNDKNMRGFQSTSWVSTSIPIYILDEHSKQHQICQRRCTWKRLSTERRLHSQARTSSYDLGCSPTQYQWPPGSFLVTDPYKPLFALLL